jgi:hypothetical protein
MGGYEGVSSSRRWIEEGCVVKYRPVRHGDIESFADSSRYDLRDLQLRIGVVRRVRANAIYHFYESSIWLLSIS